MPCGLILIRKAFYSFFDQLQSTDVRINYQGIIRIIYNKSMNGNCQFRINGDRFELRAVM